MRYLLRSGFSALAACTLLATSTPGALAAEQYPNTALIMDASGSMWAPDASGVTTRMEAAKQAAIQLVDGLPEEQKLALLTYGTGTGNSDAEKEAGCQDVKTLVPLGGAKTDVTTKISELVASGYTPIGKSLLEAEKEVGGDGASHIVLISDGIDTCAPPPVADVAREIKDRNPDMTIDVIGLNVDDATRTELQGIADAGGGTYADATDAQSLLDKLTAGSTSTEAKPTESESESADASASESESAEPSATESESADTTTAASTPEAVSGSPSADGAPSLALGGIANDEPQAQVYNDNIPATLEAGATDPADKELHWSVDLKDGEQLSAAFLVPGIAAGGAEGASMTITPELTDKDGNTCVANSTEITAEGNYGAPQSASLLSEVIATNGTCKPGTYDLSLKRTGNLVGDQTLPVELSTWAIPEVDESKLAAASDKPAVTDLALGEVSGQLPTDLSADNAPVVEAGTYSLEIAPGETRWFKVPVAEGQRLQAQLEADAPGAEGHQLNWEVFGPQLHPIQVEKGEVALNANELTTAGVATQPIRWLNLKAQDATANGFLAGDQLVAVQHQAPAGSTAPVTARVALEPVGTEETAPNFAAASEKTTKSSSGSSAWLWWLVLILLIVGLILLARWYRERNDYRNA